MRCPWAAAIVLAALTLSPCRAEPTAADADLFEKEIRPILATRCFSCHGNVAQPKGDLKLTSRTAVLAGGTRGPAAISGKPEESLLLQAIRREGGLEMPPKDTLTQREIDALSVWIEKGLPWPDRKPAVSGEAADFWSFQPVKPQPAPKVKDGGWPRRDLDHFILAKLEEAGLRPSPDASPRPLARRLYHDLIGLPPTTEEADAFEKDHSADPQAAVEKLVDTLLASPHFGVRWARHWLDNVRYAEKVPLDNSLTTVLPGTAYRDWVVRAFNADLPYDTFVRYQVAGDLLPPPDKDRVNLDALVATGVWGFAVVSDDLEKEKIFADFVDDQLDVLGRTFMGLTLSCARCHHHKFDPISQEDYYGLAGIFFSSHILKDKKARNDAPVLSSRAELDALEKQKAELKAIDKQYDDLNKKLKANKDDPQLLKLKAERERLQKAVRAVPVAMVMQEGGIPGSRHEKIGDMPVYVRGSHRDLGKTVPRGFPQALGTAGKPIGESSSGRLQLAEWLTRPEHPLTARVMANRVWQHLLGEGIVRTPSNYGQLGERPTHPELLDHLADRFAKGGWSVKKLVREITTSHAYRQTSLAIPAALKADPDNRLFSRANRRRLEAEELRDAVLLTTGGIQVEVAAEGLAKSGRSFYLPVSRVSDEPLLSLFDGADPSTIVPRRNDSTSAPQALFMLNSPFVIEQANKVATAALKAADSKDRVQAIYRAVLKRAAASEEIDRALEDVATLAKARGDSGKPKGEAAAWADFTHVLLCGNEFLYLE